MHGWAVALRLTGLGWYVAACIVLGAGGGRWLDGRLGTGVVFTLVGLLLGLVVALYGLYRMVQPLLSGDVTDRGKGDR